MSVTQASRLMFQGIALIVLVGCGSNSDNSATETPAESSSTTRPAAADTRSTAPPAARKSVCTMLPKADMEAILGGPLTNVDATDVSGKTQCTYVGFGRYADVAIEWGNGEAGMAGARLAAKFMGATAGAIQVMTPIEDLGDEAVLMIGGVLTVRKGNDLITVDLRTNKTPEVTGPVIVRKIIEQM